MNHYVADTHALFWYLTGSPRLGAQAKRAFDEGARGQAVIHIPTIVLAELYYLNEKIGRPLDFAAEYQRRPDRDPAMLETMGNNECGAALPARVPAYGD